MMPVDMNRIEDLALRIAREFKPEKIVLFGSYAYGHPTRDSDVDLLVILKFDGKPVRKAIEIRNRLNPRLPLDLLVRTPEQIANRVLQNDWFMCEILEKGRTLYAANYS
jgi:predicted nucleotidyltransferase